MALSYITSEIKRDIGRKLRIFFHTPPAFDAPVRGGPCRNIPVTFGRPIGKQEAQLSQRDRAMLRVAEYFAKSLKVTQGLSKWYHLKA